MNTITLKIQPNIMGCYYLYYRDPEGKWIYQILTNSLETAKFRASEMFKYMEYDIRITDFDGNVIEEYIYQCPATKSIEEDDE